MKNERLRMTRSALPYYVLLFCLAQFFSSCKPGRPSGILSDKEMEDVLVDYHLAKGMAECQDRDRDKYLYLYVRAALSKHGVTEARFDSSLVWYSRHSEQMADIYKSVMKRIETQANIHGISEPTGDDNPFRNLTSEGDTADVWADKRFVTLLPERLHCLYRFSLPADSTFMKGDSFIWHFKVHKISVANATSLEAQALFRLEYANDSVMYTHSNLMASTTYDLRVNPDRGLDTVPLKRVGGFIYMTPAKEPQPTVTALIVQDFSLVRMHRQKPKPQVRQDTIPVMQGEPEDSVPALPDSIQAEGSDTIAGEHPAHVRLSPGQVRDKQPRERKINVVKEKSYEPARGTRTMQRRRL